MKKYYILPLFVFFLTISFSQKKKTPIEELRSSDLSGLKFRSVGPAFMSGRIADIAINPNNENEWYVAVGSGGVWKTVNSGTTWNPIADDQPLWFLTQDAWYTSSIKDKFKIWFMPTGWRPKDVAKTIPRRKLEDVFIQEKYKFKYTLIHKIFVAFHFLTLNIVLFIFLSSFADLSLSDKTGYFLLIFSTIFSFSSVMDGYKWSINFEFLRIFLGMLVLYFQAELSLLDNTSMTMFLSCYLIASAILNLLILRSVPNRIN